MDNVTKALLISGAVLVSILLVATGVYVVNTQHPELFAKKATDTMWAGIGLGEYEEVEEYEDMGENVEINTEGGNENSTTYLRAGQLLSGTITRGKVETLTFIDTNKYKAKEGALITEDVGATQNGEIMAYAYDNDENELYEVVIGQAGGVKANPNSNRFLYKAENLKEINLKYLDTSNVTDMSGIFSCCSGLTSLDVSNFNTSNVTTMQDMFRLCVKIEELDVSNFNTANVINMISMFAYCNKIEELDLSNFNTANVTNMQGMFETGTTVTSLKKLDLSNWNTSNVTDMSFMFSNCLKLENLILGENFIIQPSTSTSYITYYAHANTKATINARLPVTE